MSVAIWWIRRDLRLGDNPALSAAQRCADQIVPLFIIDPHLMAVHGDSRRRLTFLWGGLRALDAGLRARGGRLIIRRGDPMSVLEAILAETAAVGVFAEADYTPYARRRDEAIRRALPLTLVHGVCVHPPGSILKEDGSPYTVFTPFSRAWRRLSWPEDLLEAPLVIHTPAHVASELIPERDDPAMGFPPGESEAISRLRRFCEGEQAPIFSYASLRDRLDIDGTSQLSPYLRFGMLSARQAVSAAAEALQRAEGDEQRCGVEVWIAELIWREFYVHILWHFPHVLRRAFRPELERLSWENDPAAFASWREGRTGYPLVDAAMRQLAQEGWIHNRARMVVASFLVKDLLIDWRWGEREFMRHLVDGDPAANNGGWRWTAGVGTDAAPYFRVFNPVTQGMKCDPEGRYVRRWVPELRRVPNRYIHQPWTMPDDMQRASGCRIGRDYPAPWVDHAWARARALAAYQAAMKAFGGRGTAVSGGEGAWPEDRGLSGSDEAPAYL